MVLPSNIINTMCRREDRSWRSPIGSPVHARYSMLREAAKKSFFSGLTTKSEGGDKGQTTEKKPFYEARKKNSKKRGPLT